MNIENFDEEFDRVILSRAKDYFRSGYVTSLEDDGDGEWTATVEGSRDYTVIVRLEGKEITHFECDCPYDGSFCKHEGAALLSIRERLRQESTIDIRYNEKSGAEKKAVFGKENVDDLLGTLGEDDLRKILHDILHIDERLRDEFLMRYGNKGNTAEYARKLIRTCVHKVEYRGYVEYRNVYRATGGADEVLNNIDNHLECGDALTAIALCIIVIEEMTDLINCCDDSDGHCGDMISRAVDLLAKSVLLIAETADEKEAGEIFDKICYQAVGPLNDYGGWGAELMFVAIPLCRNKTVRKKMEAYLNSPPANKHTSDFSYICDKRLKQSLQLEIIETFDGESASDDYMMRTLDNPDIRIRAIETALGRKQFEKAIQLCEDGENENNDHRGHVGEFKRYRFEAYECEGDAESQKELAKEFLLGGNFGYYGKLKALYSKADWQKVLEEILSKTKHSTHDPYYGRESLYAKIVVAEGLNEKLLEFCKENVSTITYYLSILLPLFPDEVEEVFKNHIYRSAKRASVRPQYRDVCNIILLYEESFSRKATDIKNDLTELYKKRPAFMDELKKIK